MIECKATKLTFDAQFSDNPILTANKSYAQMIKGITQIWKFFSAVRLNKCGNTKFAKNSYAILVTLESWFPASRQLQREAIAMARSNVSNDQEITEEDMKPIIFCSIQDMVDVMIISDESQFFETLDRASQEVYMGGSCRKLDVSWERSGRSLCPSRSQTCSLGWGADRS